MREHRAMSSGIMAGLPNVSEASIALVFLPMRRAAAAGSMLRLMGSTSTNTGRAPTLSTLWGMPL